MGMYPDPDDAEQALAVKYLFRLNRPQLARLGEAIRRTLLAGSH